MSRKAKLSILLGSLYLATCTVACSGGEDGLDGVDGQDGDRVAIIDIEAGEECEFGGQKIVVGTQLNDNGEPDEDADSTSVHFVCNGPAGEQGPQGDKGDTGAQGPDGRSVATVSRAADAEECDNGGTHFTFGYADDEGNIAEADILNETTICNGDDGHSPEVSALIDDTADVECLAGGFRIEFLVDGTQIATQDVCHGIDGREVLVASTDLAPDPDVCQAGGKAVSFRYDGEDEPFETVNICNGIGGQDFSPVSFDFTTLHPGEAEYDANLACPASYTILVVRDQDGNPLQNASEVVCHGTEGPQGKQGCSATIAVGTSSVDSEGRLCREITNTTFTGEDCEIPSETSYNICDGKDGKDGVDGADGNPGCDGDTITQRRFEPGELPPIPGQVECTYGGTRVTVQSYEFDAQEGQCVDGSSYQFDICDGAGAVCQLTPFGQCENIDFTDPNGRFAPLNGDLSNLNLRYINFNGAILNGVNFAESDLTGATFVGAQVVDASLSDGKFNNTDFTGANLTNAESNTTTTFHDANFNSADLSGAGNFTDDTLSGAVFNAQSRCPDQNLATEVTPGDGVFGCRGNNAQLRICRLIPNGACVNFNLVDRGAIPTNLAGIDLTGTSFIGDTIFDGDINLSGAILAGTTFNPGTQFQGSLDLRNAHLNPAEIDNIQYGPATFAGITFPGDVRVDGANLTQASFAETTFDGNVSLQGANLSAAIFDDVTFTGAVNARGANLTGTSFNGGNFQDQFAFDASTLLDYSNFSGVTFHNNIALNQARNNSSTPLRGTNFSHAQFLDGLDAPGLQARALNFSGAQLQGANFRGAVFAAPNDPFAANELTLFNSAQLNGANFSSISETSPGITTIIRLTSFEGAALEGANFAGVSIGTGPQDGFSNSDTWKTSFANADFGSGANFSNADLRDSNFAEAEATDTLDFSGSQVLRSNFKDAKLPNLDATDAVFSGNSSTMTDFSRAELPGLKGHRSAFAYTDFTDADLSNADLGATLERDPDNNNEVTGYFFANLINSNFTGADLTNANLAYAFSGSSSVNFEDAILDGADLRGFGHALPITINSGTSFNGATRCPNHSFGINGCVTTALQACLLFEDGLGLTYRAGNGRNPTNSTRTCVNGDLAGVDSDDLLMGLRDRNLPGINFNGAILSGASLAGSTLIDATFYGAEMSAADLNSALLLGADFDNADLTNAVLQPLDSSLNNGVSLQNTFVGTVFDGVDLRGLDLSGKSFFGASFVGTDFGPRMPGEQLTRLDNTEFMQSTFTNTNFTGAELSYAIFDESTFDGTNFTGAVLSLADFRDGAQVSNVPTFSNVNLKDANIREARFFTHLKDIIFDVYNIAGANFTGSTLENTDFSEAESIFSGETYDALVNVIFDDATFSGEAKFSNNIRGGSWQWAALDQAIVTFNKVTFTAQDGNGVNLTGLCGLTAAELGAPETHVSFHSSTTCPDGLGPSGGGQCVNIDPVCPGNY